MHCYVCLSSHKELRPYGEGGQPICFDCAMSNPARKNETAKQFNTHLNQIKETKIVLTEYGPVGASHFISEKKD
jgi:hypothetical protein